MTKDERLNKLASIVGQCRACALVEGRTKIVFGEGNPDAKIMFIGEAPGKDEDRAGIPFVGRSGQLLRNLIRAIGLDPVKDCFIANICKCRPPNNRPPEQEEIDICVKFLQKQIEIMAPRVLVLLGRTAVRGLLPECSDVGLDILRNKSRMEPYTVFHVPVIITYHPSALLRDPSKKVKVAEDFRFIQGVITNLYKGTSNGHSTGIESPEQLPVTEGVGVHGGEGRNSESKAYRLPSLFSEDEGILA